MDKNDDGKFGFEVSASVQLDWTAIAWVCVTIMVLAIVAAMYFGAR